VAGGETIGDLAGPVVTTVVYHHDGMVRTHGGDRPEHVLHGAREVALLTKRRHHDGDAVPRSFSDRSPSG